MGKMEGYVGAVPKIRLFFLILRAIADVLRMMKTIPNNRLYHDRLTSGAVDNPGGAACNHIDMIYLRGRAIWTSPFLHPEINFSSVKIRFLDWNDDVHMKD